MSCLVWLQDFSVSRETDDMAKTFFKRCTLLSGLGGFRVALLCHILLALGAIETVCNASLQTKLPLYLTLVIMKIEKLTRDSFSEDRENAAIQFLEDGGSDDDGFGEYDSVAGKRHSWSSLFWFFSKSHYLALTGALGFTIISGLVVPFMSIVLGHIFDSLAKFGLGTYTRDALLQRITGLIWNLVLLGVAGFLSSGFFYALWQLLAEFQARRARECVLEGLLEKQLVWFDKRKSGVAAMLTASQTYVGSILF